MREARPSYVYFAAPVGGGNIKIGCSRVPLARLRGLASWSPVPLEILAFLPGDHRLEFHLHSLFFEHHSHHEWFYPSSLLLGLVECVKSKGTLPKWAVPTGVVRNPRAARSKPSAVRTPEWRRVHGEAVKRGWEIRKSRLADNQNHEGAA